MDLAKKKVLSNKSIMVFKTAFDTLSKLAEQPKSRLYSVLLKLYVNIENFPFMIFCCATIGQLRHQPGTQYRLATQSNTKRSTKKFPFLEFCATLCDSKFEILRDKNFLFWKLV